MEMSFWIAKLLGPILVITAIPMVIRPQTINELAIDSLKSRPLIYITGILVLVAGLSIVNTHNLWRLDWTVFITLFGWALVIGGAARIIAPNVVTKAGHAMTGGQMATRISGVAWGVVGALFSIMGYA